MSSPSTLLLEKTATTRQKKGNIVLVVHGGAGILKRSNIPEDKAHLYKEALVKALHAGYNVLVDGGEAMDAAAAAVTVLEDCPLFNAGKGAVFNKAGKNELEASIMLSKPPQSNPEILSSRRGAAATLLTRIRNPSQLVKALYLAPNITPHVLLSGEEAQRIGADELGQTVVDPSYFWTEKRWREHRRGLGLPEEPLPYPADGTYNDNNSSLDVAPKGTVGAVALDVNSSIAVVTSTGGLTNKIVGRIGDTPLMGSGFWAEEWPIRSLLKRAWRKCLRKPVNRAVGVSGTGDGDYFIRTNAASTVAAWMKLSGKSLEEGSRRVIDELGRQGGSGGLIAIDDQGNYTMPMTQTAGMFRGVIDREGTALTAIFSDDILS